jgi:hypothetical protein
MYCEQRIKKFRSDSVASFVPDADGVDNRMSAKRYFLKTNSNQAEPSMPVSTVYRYYAVGFLMGLVLPLGLQYGAKLGLGQVISKLVGTRKI